jgi:hypothetical protein
MMEISELINFVESMAALPDKAFRDLGPLLIFNVPATLTASKGEI